MWFDGCSLSRADFAYDVEADAYTCPAGKPLRRRRRLFKTPRPEALSDDTIRYRPASATATSAR